MLLPLVLALFMSGEKLKDVRDVLMEYSPLNGLASLYRIPMAADDPNATGWPLLGILAGRHRRGARRRATRCSSKRDV